MRTPAAYKIADLIAGGCLLFAVIWAPWAFGCTVHWAVWILNAAGYLLGATLVAKWVIRWRAGYIPERWAAEPPRWWKAALGLLTVVFLAYVLTSLLNWRARVVEITVDGPVMEYREGHIPWLPHSYDAIQTAKGFWRYLALAGLFWGGRDWLAGRSRRERRAEDDTERAFPPARLRWLLWTLCLSSALLAIVAVLQRLDGTQKLLWLITPPVTQKWSIRSFGPFAYRANGAQFCNLIWPACLAFWWMINERYRRQRGLAARAGNDPSLVLLALAALIAGAPFVATSRGGVLILIAQVLAAITVLWAFGGRAGQRGRRAMAVVLLVGIGLGAGLGWKPLLKRFENILVDPSMSGRDRIYEMAGRMASDFGRFGSGAETFPTLSGLYRETLGEKWEGYVHNDWLETRLSLGWTGTGLVVGLLGLTLAAPFVARGGRRPGQAAGSASEPRPSGPGAPPPPPTSISSGALGLFALGLGGMLVHAWFDFPFQVVGLLATHLILLVAWTCLGAGRLGGASDADTKTAG